MEEPYTKRETDLLHEGILGELKGLRSELKGMKEQMKIANGRTTNLERWQYSMMGGIAVISLVVVPIAIWVINQII